MFHGTVNIDRSTQTVEYFSLFFQLVKEHFTVEEIPEDQQDPVYHSPDIHLLKLKRKV